MEKELICEKEPIRIGRRLEELQHLISQAFILNVVYQVNKNYVALRADTMTYDHPGAVFFRHKELSQVKPFFIFKSHYVVEIFVSLP